MLKNFLSLFLQSPCPLCQRRTQDWLCSYCLSQLLSYKHNRPHQLWSGALPRFIWGYYDGKLKQIIAALKFEKRPELGIELGLLLGEAWLQAPMGKLRPLVVPIPLHPDKLKERGFNQAELLAQGFCRLTRYPLHPQGLLRVKNTAALFALDPQARRETLKDALALGPSLAKVNQPVLLLDDILTTGATAEEAQKVLKQNGKSVLGIAALASSLALRP
ncbi:MAG: ComF family protein [Cyanobacteriota bacterium]